MNIDTEQYNMLCRWLACVEILPDETALAWAIRALAMRVDKEAVMIGIDRVHFNSECKKIADKFLGEMKLKRGLE